jgi:hypothetical protein
MKGQEHKKELCRYLDTIGATHISYDNNGRGRHGRLLFRYNGKDLSMSISRSPSDHRAYWSAVKIIRRLTGVR